MDKVKHFVVSAAIVFVANLFWPIWAGIVLALAVGIAKELYDSTRPNNKFDGLDLLADCLGVIFAVVICQGGIKL